jgi:sulfur-carrier protein
MSAKTIRIQYYALLREQRGCSQESWTTDVETALDLYEELKLQYGFKLHTELLKVAVNEAFCPWETVLNDNDAVVFIPPVAGG